GIRSDSPDLARFPEVYLKHLTREIEQPAPPNSLKAVMPGVRELLDRLVERSERGDVVLALLTGNYEPGARVKLEHFASWRYFALGAFGDGATDRNAVLPKAVHAVNAHNDLVVGIRNTILIGDTPLVIACAAAGGARSIGVATGSFTVDQLRSAGADMTFKD